MKRFSILLLSMICFALPTHISAVDFEITSVRQLGDATWTIAPGLVKFSPSGALVSYFHNSSIVVSDTAGTVISEFPLIGKMMKYEWVNDSLLVVMEIENSKALHSVQRLALLDLSTHLRSVVREVIPLGQSGLQWLAFIGLYRSSSGLVFTKSAATGNLLKIDETGVKSESVLRRSPDVRNSDMELFWGRGGLFKRTVGSSDSVWVGPRPVGPYVAILDPVWDPEFKYAIVGGTLWSLEDSAYVVIDTMIGSPPEGFITCGVEVPSFNPIYPELVFNLVCYGKEQPTDHDFNKERDHVALVDTDSWEITLLDTLIGLTECSAPAYSPDGLSLTVLSHGRIYIVSREVK